MWHLLAGAAVTVYDRKLKETIMTMMYSPVSSKKQGILLAATRGHSIRSQLKYLE